MDLSSYQGLISLLDNNPVAQLIVVVIAVWALAWKGIALWKAARNNQRNWYIALVIINSFGILEIIYIFWFSKPKVVQAPNQPQPPVA